MYQNKKEVSQKKSRFIKTGVVTLKKPVGLTFSSKNREIFEIRKKSINSLLYCHLSYCIYNTLKDWGILSNINSWNNKLKS